MIRSMTGYGEAERETAAGLLRVEIKTVNHRFFSANIRLSSSLDRFETQIREWLRDGISRGHVNCTVRFEAEEGNAPALRLDAQRAREYIAIFQAMKDELGVRGDVDVALLSRFSDVITREDREHPELDESELEEAVRAAVGALVTMRETEGRALRTDLEKRLDDMRAGLDRLEEQGPQRLVAERDRLREAVSELAGHVDVDEDRLAREIAYLAEKWDVSEEIVRQRAHVDHFHELLEEDSAEPVGKRLAFLVQEMHREANTIGSKANHAVMEHGVVAMKNEIERLREQVENIE